MAIKYYVVPHEEKVVAVLSGTQFDVINKIEKMCGDLFVVNYNKYRLPNLFREVVKTFDGDVFDEEVGKQLVKKKLMEKYYSAHDAKVVEFYKDMAAKQEKIAEYIEKNSSVKA